MDLSPNETQWLNIDECMFESNQIGFPYSWHQKIMSSARNLFNHCILKKCLEKPMCRSEAAGSSWCNTQPPQHHITHFLIFPPRFCNDWILKAWFMSYVVRSVSGIPWHNNTATAPSVPEPRSLSTHQWATQALGDLCENQLRCCFLIKGGSISRKPLSPFNPAVINVGTNSHRT